MKKGSWKVALVGMIILQKEHLLHAWSSAFNMIKCKHRNAVQRTAKQMQSSSMQNGMQWSTRKCRFKKGLLSHRCTVFFSTTPSHAKYHTIKGYVMR